MKLSDIKGDRTLEVIADIIEPIANIASDKEAMELFTRKKLPKGLTPKQFLLMRAKKALPVLLRGHKGDIIAILATIGGTSPEEYAKNLDLVKLTRDFVELLTDDAFKAFFISAQSGEDEKSSGSAPENTEATEA